MANTGQSFEDPEFDPAHPTMPQSVLHLFGEMQAPSASTARMITGFSDIFVSCGYSFVLKTVNKCLQLLRFFFF